MSYNQPLFCSNATWNSRGITLINSTFIGSSIPTSFVDINNNLYVASASQSQAQFWLNGSDKPTRNFSTGINAPSAIFVDFDGNIYVDNGGNPNRRVDKWTLNSSTSIPVMYVPNSCFFLFIDILDNLYCSLGGLHRIIRNSLNGHINDTSTVAGNGTSGTASNQLNAPRGIFVSINMTLYVADAFNDRIQMYSSGNRNGITLIGNGSTISITLNRPVGIIMDGNGYLFIADSWNDRIIGSGPFGFRCLIGCSSTRRSISLPRTIHFDTDGNLIAMDSGNIRMQKFLLMTNSCCK